jgi:hypothetical protein
MTPGFTAARQRLAVHWADGITSATPTVGRFGELDLDRGGTEFPRQLLGRAGDGLGRNRHRDLATN